MGKIRTKTVKRAARQVVEKYYSKLTRDFYNNKRVILDVTVAASRKLQNKIAGYASHIIKRLAKGPVRGISLKLQEEERERRMDFVPEVSWVDQKIKDGISVDKHTFRMLSKLENGVPKFVRLNRDDAVAAAPVRGGKGAPNRGAPKKAVKAPAGKASKPARK